MVGIDYGKACTYRAHCPECLSIVEPIPYHTRPDHIIVTSSVSQCRSSLELSIGEVVVRGVKVSQDIQSSAGNGYEMKSDESGTSMVQIE